MERYCGYCGQGFTFNPARPNQLYCQSSCRHAANRKPRTNDEKNAARKIKSQNHVTTFIAVDGEGIDTYETVEKWDEPTQQMVLERVRSHHYVLISVGDKSYHRNGELLTADEIYEFLYSQKLENPDAAFVGFFLGYDFSQWFRTMPAKHGWKLFDREEIAKRLPNRPDAKFPYPVYYKRWELDILGMKRFKLRPIVSKKDRPQCVVAHKSAELIDECASGKHNKHPYKWMYICDAGAFFQTALMNAIDPTKWKPGTEIVTPGELAILQEGKDNRSTAVFDEKMIQYNVLENEVLARLMNTVNAGFVADGIRLKANQWFGPGQAAQAWMRLVQVPTGDDVREAVPQWALEAAQQSYFGGWFEIMMHGIVPGTTYSYDINSAYPYTIAKLPCLLHGKWTRGEGKPPHLPRKSYQLIDAQVVGRDKYIGAMPHRDLLGNILRPSFTAGWYWQHEIDAARKAGVLSTASVYRWVRYDPCDCPPPAAAIAELYKSRILVDKNSPYGKSKKLVYNSAYGKFAQSVGIPVFSNSIYASLITTGCRAMILEAIATHPDKAEAVAMVATDSVTFLTPHPLLPIDKDALGKWDATEYENLSLMMPGLYWNDKSRQAVAEGITPKLKSRGVSARDLGQFINRIDDGWEKLIRKVDKRDLRGWYGEDCPEVEINVAFSLISPKLAVHRNDWWQCGLVRWNEKRVLRANPVRKRGEFLRVVDTYGRTVVRTSPYQRVENPRSMAYDRRFGDERNPVTDDRELSEWLTRDGNIDMELREGIPT